MDDPDAQLAGDVGGGEHRDHPVGRRGSRRVDGEHVGPGVRGQVEGGVEQARDAQVVDVAPVAEAQLAGLVLRPAAPTPAERALERLALGHRLDGVEDLDVAGAPAQVGAEVAGHRLRSRSAPFLSTCALARMTIPGMQKPHCSPPQAAKASAKRCAPLDRRPRA